MFSYSVTSGHLGTVLCGCHCSSLARQALLLGTLAVLGMLVAELSVWRLDSAAAGAVVCISPCALC